MSYLLGSLGRGLLGHLTDAFDRQLPGDRDEDLEALQARLERSPTSVDLALRLATGCLRARNYTAALALFRTLEGRAEPQASIGLACVADARGDLDAAARFLEAAARADHWDPAIRFGLGFCRERTGDLEGAARGYRTALASCDRLRNAHERLAAIAVLRRDWDAAIGAYDRLVDLEPDEIEFRLLRGCLKLERGRPADAIEDFQQALLIEPEAIDPSEADALSETDATLAARIHTASRLAAKYPGVTEFRLHLADLYAEQGDDEAAVREYRAALDLRPNFLEATIKLGTQHARRRRYCEAAETFSTAVELNDRLLSAFVGLGVAQRLAGRGEEAQATFDLAVSLSPNSGLLLMEASRLVVRAAACSELSPGGTGGTPDAEEDVLAETLRRHEHALRGAPRDADLQCRYGTLLWHVGEHDRAIAAFRAAVEACPTSPRALLRLGTALHESGDASEAADAFVRTVLLEGPEIDTHYALALLFTQRVHFELSVEEFTGRCADTADGQAARHSIMQGLANTGVVDRAATGWSTLRAICAGDGLDERPSLRSRAGVDVDRR